MQKHDHDPDSPAEGGGQFWDGPVAQLGLVLIALVLALAAHMDAASRRSEPPQFGQQQADLVVDFIPLPVPGTLIR